MEEKQYETKEVILKGVKWVISSAPLPPRGGGRPKRKNNYDKLIELGVNGIITNQYKSYAEAARDLYPQAREYFYSEEVPPKYYLKKSIVSRLSRGISKLHKARIS